MAPREWQESSFVEGPMLDFDGYVIEGTMCNLFFVHGWDLIMPDFSRCGVAGISREIVMEEALQCGIPLHPGQYGLDENKAANEVLICSSLISIRPVCQLEERQFNPRPVSQQFMNRLEIEHD